MKSFLVAIALLAATPALAIDFTTTITQPDGTPFQSPNDPKRSLTLSDVAGTALFSDYQGEQLAPADKQKRYVLGMRIYNNKDAKLTVEEIALIKTLIGKAYNPLIMGRAYDILDPAENTEKK